jgi:adenylylsulfate kinase-like enzyme
VLVAAISPFREDRDKARALIGDFMEIHVATPLEECVRRDVKGLYKKAMSGDLLQFTGISDPYEEPSAPELRLDTSCMRVDQSVALIFGRLRELGYLDGHAD